MCVRKHRIAIVFLLHLRRGTRVPRRDPGHAPAAAVATAATAAAAVVEIAAAAGVHVAGRAAARTD